MLQQDKVMAPRLAAVGVQCCWHHPTLCLSQWGVKPLGEVFWEISPSPIVCCFLMLLAPSHPVSVSTGH